MTIDKIPTSILLPLSGILMKMLDVNDLCYFIMLDPIKWQFALSSKTIFNARQKRFRFKHLNLNKLKKFGTVSSQIENEVGQQILCGVCNRWVYGLCFKHPLIFIKEEIPQSLPYIVFETMPKFLNLRESRIRNAGYGIFSKIDLPSGLAFGPYSGYLSKLKLVEMTGYSWW
uniref:Uncharacterized protein n=1 Tax=Romanomermis culicivorax TaxID=13658 RepID=A0A915JF81_ROMCU